MRKVGHVYLFAFPLSDTSIELVVLNFWLSMLDGNSSFQGPFFFFKKTLYSDSFIKLWTVRNALAYCLARICSGVIMQVIFTWRDHGWLQMLFMQVVCHLPANNSVWSGTLTRRNRSIIAILKTQMFCIKSLWIFSVFELRKSCFLTKHCSFWFFLL